MKYINKATLKKLFFRFAMLTLLLGSIPFIWHAIIQRVYGQKIFAIEEVPPTQIAIVLGAGIDRNNNLSDVLRDRMDVAIQLYQEGRVQTLLVSGDNRFENYDEPGAMKAYAIANGVAAEDIQPDYGGRRTYDSCYRAKHIFQVEEAIVVTQEFHLPRALYNCNQLGIDAIGVSADLQPYLSARWFVFREIPATLMSGWDLLQKKPAPVMGEVIPLAQ